ncbi:MAG: HEAT repeat domain-containing protein [Candidatus Micrarchaeota archaeon]
MAAKNEKKRAIVPVKGGRLQKLKEVAGLPVSDAIANAFRKVSEGTMRAAKKNIACPDSGKRFRAIAFLGIAGAEEHIALLSKSIDDAERECGREAVIALGRIDSPLALPPLRAALSHRDSGIRSLAALELGEKKDEESIDLLICLIEKDPHSPAVPNAVDALGKIGGLGAVPALISLFATENERGEIAKQIAQGIFPDLEVIPKVVASDLWRSADVESRAQDALMKILDSCMGDLPALVEFERLMNTDLEKEREFPGSLGGMLPDASKETKKAIEKISGRIRREIEEFPIPGDGPYRSAGDCRR